MSKFEEQDRLITADILKNIEAYRMHITFVDGDGYEPRFGYSIGFYKEFRHPELILIGLDADSTGIILNHVKSESEIEAGTRFIVGLEYSNFLVDLPIPIRFVYHDEDGDWQFHSEQDPDPPKAKIVSLERLVSNDPTLNEIYYLNYGESASRSETGREWEVSRK